VAKWLFGPVFIWQYISIYYKLFLSGQKPLVIILTIGKVGSSSVYYSLKEQFSSRIFHVHFISEEGINKAWHQHKTSSRKSVPLHLITSKILQKLLKRYAQKYFIITMFREPVQRKISSFFQNLDQHKEAVSLNGLEFDASKVNEILNDAYFLSRLDEEDQWIENELMKTYHFKVYNPENIIKNGFSIERKNNVDLLSLKMENLNDEFYNAMHQFFESEHQFILKTVNDGEEKYYNEAYKGFKKNFKLREQTLNKICNTTYFSNFYQDSKSSVINKWKK
jgi:hypothetical protein